MSALIDFVRRHFAIAIVLAISFLAIRWGHGDESPTTDEWAHFIRGVVGAGEEARDFAARSCRPGSA